MGARFIDFDAEAGERHAEPIGFKLLGKDYEVPGEPPAAGVIRIARIVAQVREDHGHVDLSTVQLPDEQVLLLVADMLPPKVLASLQADGVTTTQLAGLIHRLLGEWKVLERAEEAIARGEAVAPPGAHETPSTPGSPSGASSTAGATSSPTSAESTASTFAAPALPG